MSTTNRDLKVYGAIAYVRGDLHDTLVQRGMVAHTSQARVIVATTSRAAAARLMGLSPTAFKHSGCETGNDVEKAVALSSPGEVFYAPLHAARGAEQYVTKGES